MKIAGMVKSSLIDYPGKVSCVLFVHGCNLNCFYCHNRPLIQGTNDLLNLFDVIEFLNKRKDILDGIVITGGEPTLQADLLPFMELIKSLGYSIKLDTNGSSPEIVEDIINKNLCDYLAVDYKAPNMRYKEICGLKANADNVLKTINLILDSKINFEVRTTVIPQLCLEDLVIMAKELPVVPKYVLNKYRMPEKYLPCDKERIEMKPYLQDEINEFAIILKEYQPNITK